MLKEKKLLFTLSALLVIILVVILVRSSAIDSEVNKENDYLNSLRAKSQQTVYLTEPISKLANPVKGDSKARLSLYVFGSYTCSYCAQMGGVLNNLLSKYPKDLKLIWKDFTPESDQTGLRAAVAARCAQDQGKFWEYHDVLMANQASLSDKFYSSTASSLQLNMSKFQKCFDNLEDQSLVKADFDEGVSLRIDGLPYFFINGQRLSGAIPETEFESIIKSFL